MGRLKRLKKKKKEEKKKDCVLLSNQRALESLFEKHRQCSPGIPHKLLRRKLLSSGETEVRELGSSHSPAMPWFFAQEPHPF